MKNLLARIQKKEQTNPNIELAQEVLDNHLKCLLGLVDTTMQDLSPNLKNDPVTRELALKKYFPIIATAFTHGYKHGLEKGLKKHE